MKRPSEGREEDQVGGVQGSGVGLVGPRESKGPPWLQQHKAKRWWNKRKEKGAEASS